jgi:hypothetical protein
MAGLQRRRDGRAGAGKGNQMSTPTNPPPPYEELKQHPVFQHIWANRSGIVFSRKGGIIRRLRPGLSSKGYPRLNLYWRSPDGKRQIGKDVHVLVLEIFRGQCPEGHEASHLDGNKLNSCLDNLLWETKSQNNSRKAQHGTLLFGMRHPSTRLSDSDVREIRRLHANGIRNKVLARRFGMSHAMISGIYLGQARKHVC